MFRPPAVRGRRWPWRSRRRRRGSRRSRPGPAGGVGGGKGGVGGVGAGGGGGGGVGGGAAGGGGGKVGAEEGAPRAGAPAGVLGPEPPAQAEERENLVVPGRGRGRQQAGGAVAG